jgi:Fic family protein
LASLAARSQLLPYIPPPPEEVEPCLAAWEKFLHEATLPPLVTVALAHYQFEAVHPFLDGNGRVGRLLITLFLIEHQILSTPLLYLSAFFEASRREYYFGLRRISERGAWNDWLEYFLLGVARMSEDALSRAMLINGLLAEWLKIVSGQSSNNPLRVVELLGQIRSSPQKAWRTNWRSRLRPRSAPSNDWNVCVS